MPSPARPNASKGTFFERKHTLQTYKSTFHICKVSLVKINLKQQIIKAKSVNFFFIDIYIFLDRRLT